MVKKRSVNNGKSKDSGKVDFRGFLPVTLNSEERRFVKDNPLSEEDINQFIRDAVFNGYKFSASWHGGQDCYTVTLYGNKRGHPDAGYAMSIRHRDFVTACTALHWCLDTAGTKGSFSAWIGDTDELNW